MRDAFDRTYEGLKRRRLKRVLTPGTPFDRTYEGLKLAQIWGAPIPQRVF